MQPLHFVPHVLSKVWGGRKLQDKLGKDLPDLSPYGESWELSDHTSHHSMVANGPLQGKTLRQLMDSNRRELLGTNSESFPVFPWLVKFLDANDWLSVQVHPDEHAVKTLWPGEGSKTEAWFIVDVQPGARIYAGLKDGVDRDTLAKVAKEGTIAEYLHSFEPKPGNCVFLPAGTVHAIGGGILLAEIQQTSDATFRLFDWNRKDAQGNSRELHLEQSLASIHWDKGEVQPIHVDAFAQESPQEEKKSLVDCPYFSMEYIGTSQQLPLLEAQTQCLMVVRGDGFLHWDSHSEPLQTGQVWLLPAQRGNVVCQPNRDVGLLLCTLP